MADHEIKKFASGVHNREDNEDTPKDSAKDSLNWVTIDGRLELARGKVTVELKVLQVHVQRYT